MTTFLRPSKKSLKNAQHFAFIEAFITALAAAGLSAAKITVLLAELRTAFSEEDRLFMIARASEIIAQRIAADRNRDKMYSRLRNLIFVWAGSGHATLDAEATPLKRLFDLYKVKTSAQLDEESGQLENLISDLSTPEMQARLQALDAQWLFEQMVSAHELVKSLRLEQGVEESEKVTGAVKAARQKCDELYDKITYLIEAFALAADDPVPYEAFIKRWNGTLKLYQDTLGRKGGGGKNNEDNGGGSDEQGGGSDDNGGDTPTPTPDSTPDPDPSGSDDDGTPGED
jgi:hypothetical protein